MATLTPQEIESLKEQLKEKTEEIRAIYGKLAEAGETDLPDDCLNAISGGIGGSPNPTFYRDGSLRRTELPTDFPYGFRP